MKKFVLITETDTEDQDYFYNHIVEVDENININELLEKATTLNYKRILKRYGKMGNLINPSDCLEYILNNAGAKKIPFEQYEWLT